MVKRLAILLGILALLVGCGDSGGSDSGDAGGTADGGAPATDMPAEIVAALGTKVVVLSSKDGTVKRTLVEGETGITSVAVTPDRSTVYFTRDDLSGVCGDEPAFQVTSVPLDGGTPEVFASGSNAVVSPDGRRIAFATGGPNQCGPQSYLAIQDLGTQQFSQQLLEGGEDATLVPLGWSADSSRVLYNVQRTDSVEAREAEPDSGAQTRVVALPEGGYLPTHLGDSGSLAVAQDDGQQVRVLEIDATTGEVGGTLFELDTRTMLRSDTADPTGRNLLFTTTTGATGGERIWRWSAGAEPVVLFETARGESAEDADWVPSPNGE